MRVLLKSVRLETGLTQMEMAARLRSRPQSYVSKSESGERKIDLVELEEICEAIGVDLLDFVRRYQASRAPD
ncbi:helix-turn-helix domain-containing protein [Stagnimonas aquatica]|uniref:helix-turn-helix domain-containing protein n=1 Tax=Stagnimonas aquatica TaxID=2689987 RepID=UPI0018F4E631|nr:helix-turn-helix transcriptional regulator [Stagnimonas aquatica]